MYEYHQRITKDAEKGI